MLEAWKRKKPTDISQLAYQIVQKATQEVKGEIPIKDKNPAAVALGRLGGLKGGDRPGQGSCLLKNERE